MKLEGLLDDARRPRHFPRPRRVEAHGVSTFYLEAGKGPPVVLLHGLGATNASMLPTMRDLARDHHVIAPDLPGFGESSKPVRPYHAGFFARWLVALLDRLGIERAHLVGNSMGGRIAIEAGLRAPERVQRLALLAPAVAFRKLRHFVPLVRLLRPELGAVPIFFPRATVLSTLRLLFADCKRLPAAWYEAAADEFLRIAATPRGRICLFSAARQIYLDDPWGERGFWPRLARLERPALFVWGDRDLLVPVKFCRHVSRALPNAECVILPDCGHVPQFEHPQRTHALVRRFFGSR
jgi:pimeloyl-ACP methyl ester carboxylesterase